jgi:mono/diheme cytochrome c family protein
MRGVIEVVDPTDPGDTARLPTQEPPLYQKLGTDLDAMPELDPRVEQSLIQLNEPPSAKRGEALKVTLPSELQQRDWLRMHSPAEAFLLLKSQSEYSGLSGAQLWDMVAYAWRNAATQEVLERGARLFTRDCAACHGEQGRGDGPVGRDLPGLQKMMPEAKRGPADFTDMRRMAALSDVFLQGKLLRGGMGTGMPEFGSLYSTDDQWAVIAYIRTFMSKHLHN